jgi:hypothetical protein
MIYCLLVNLFKMFESVNRILYFLACCGNMIIVFF